MRKYILYLLAILLAACSKSVPYSDETIKNDLQIGRASCRERV